jgi:hypothetical protein
MKQIELSSVPLAHRHIEVTSVGFFFGDSSDMHWPKETWADAKALASELSKASDRYVGFRRFIYDPEIGKKLLDPGWVFFRGKLIRRDDILSGKAEKDNPGLIVKETMKGNFRSNDRDCLWFKGFDTAWSMNRDKDVFVDIGNKEGA